MFYDSHSLFIVWGICNIWYLSEDKNDTCFYQQSVHKCALSHIFSACLELFLY